MYTKDGKSLTYKKAALIVIVLFSGLLFIITQNLNAEESGFKYFKNYSPKEYDHYPQNWAMVQAENGIIYVANQAGLLEFDGVSWRVIQVPGYDPVRSLAINKTGTLYIGGKNKIGYLTPDSTGTLKYQSLLDRIEDKYKNFSNVWNTHATKDGIYFRTSKFLFRWDYREIKKWEPDMRVYGSYYCKNELFFFSFQEKAGFIKMVNDFLELIPSGKEFENVKKIFMIVPYDSQRLLIGTRPNGFYIYDGKKMVPFPTEVEEYLNKKRVSQGIRLSNGDLAMATHLGGLVIMDPHGRQKYIFDKSYGLQDDNVKHVFEDNQGNLWLCLDKGISKIEYSSPISIHDERSNLSGLVLSIIKHHNDLYVGTTTGLYRLETSLKFSLIPGMSASCWSLLSTEDSILAATAEGVFQVKEKVRQEVIEDQSFILLPSKRYPGRTWCGTNNGLVVLSQKNGRWMEEHRFETINQQIRYILEDKNGDLWLGTSTGDVLKVDFPVDIEHPAVTPYDTSHGLPGGRVYVAEAAGHVIFATDKGIFRFDEKNKVFITDRTLGVEFAGGTDSKPVFRIAEDKNKNIWFHSESKNYQAVLGPSDSYTINSTPFRRIPTTFHVNAIYPAPYGKAIWFATNEGLIRYDTTIKKNYLQDFQVLVRKVYVNEKLIFDGCKSKIDKASKELFPIFEYQERNLRFDFAAPFFEAETETKYQSFLEGFDDDWSDWGKDVQRDYTNLDAGQYSFRVRAKNVYYQTSGEDVFQFKILLPWYRTWWAFLSYAFVLFMFTYLIFKWQRSIKLEHEKQRLEQIVKERTKEINEKSQQLEKQTLKLKDQSEKLKEMDKVKSRFFANISHEFRTPLTLIMGPIEQMLSSSRDKKQENKLKVMLQNSQRLLTLINQLLDLSRFDSGKMKLLATRQNIVPFLKGILASFDMLAHKNGLELEFQCEEEDIPLYFDAQKMEEAMYNLLINAVKFTPIGGKITVSVIAGKADFLEISVRDTGIGIPKEQFVHIFDRFYQAGSPGEKSLKGTGIGLALAKEIVTLHHGKIDVHSQEGKGTEFVIRLPMGHEHLKPDEITATSETVTDYKKAKELETLYVPAEGYVERKGDEDVKVETDQMLEDKTEKQEKNVILVVEDNTDVRKYIREPLELLYTVVEASDGKEGITKAQEIIPDLIVSDIMMPETDGYQLCRELKKDVKTSHIPIILLTAKASEESIIHGLETGADDYITKPFNTKILLTRIKNLIDLRRQLQLKIQRQKMLLPAEISVSPMDKEFLKEFQEIINKNLSDPDFNVDLLSEKLYMGRSTLFRKIQALTGETPNQFIQSYRLERATQLLKANFGNVTEVALEVGFSSAAYFSKCFKDKFHQSPSSFQASESSAGTKE
jgi:signal transduction histidine kinase/DNA-binding response OmpR family regulator